MLGGKNRQPLGYTILEVMIVLAVSGFMFVIAASFIEGKQQRTSFTTGVNEMASRIQDVIGQVTDGQYTDIPFKCQSDASGALTFSNASVSQGTNTQCVFLGKFLHFTPNSQKDSYEVFSLAGNRLNTSGAAVTTLANARPTPIVDSASPHVVDLTTQEVVPQHLDVQYVQIDDSSTSNSPVDGFGFIQGLGKADAANGTIAYASGAQTLDLVYVPGLNTGNSSEDAAVGTITSGPFVSADKVVICLSDGQRFATITVGSSNNKLNVETQLGLSACP